MKKALLNFAKEESGAAIVEYGLALLVVAGVGVAGFSLLAGQTSQNILEACQNVSNVSVAGVSSVSGNC